MTERKLASVRRIVDIVAIPDADAIECAVVDGWKMLQARLQSKTYARTVK